VTYSLTPGERFSASLSGVYTGDMLLVHFAGAPEQSVDEYVTTSSFFELGVKIAYTFKFKVVDSGLELFAGVKNLTNDFQNDFDTLRDRDSGYVYGPGAPRTFYLGLRLHSF
jgi:outer membrane receptor for ferrienterochelin and colicins